MISCIVFWKESDLAKYGEITWLVLKPLAMEHRQGKYHEMQMLGDENRMEISQMQLSNASYFLLVFCLASAGICLT